MTTFTDDNFKTEVSEFDGVVLIDFWAEWCTPCKIQGPIIDALAEKLANNPKLKIGKLDVDNNPETQAAYSVMSIPTLIIYKNGEVVDSLVGLRQEEDIEEAIQAALAS
jgi:thioredoxin 1